MESAPGIYDRDIGGHQNYMGVRGRHSNRHSKPVTLDDANWRAVVSQDTNDFSLGERVFHQKFGYGRIITIDGDKLEIAFEKAGNKKVIGSFIEPV